MGDVFTQRRIELETRIEQARQTEVNFESIERFCEQWRQNLGDFTFEDKRLVLEALSIKVWVDGNEINIEGAMLVAGDDIVSETARCFGYNRNNSFPFRILVVARQGEALSRRQPS